MPYQNIAFLYYLIIKFYTNKWSRVCMVGSIPGNQVNASISAMVQIHFFYTTGEQYSLMWASSI
jgi:hypothetical protein